MNFRLASRLIRHRRAGLGAPPTPTRPDSPLIDLVDNGSGAETDHGVMTPHLADLAR